MQIGKMFLLCCLGIFFLLSKVEAEPNISAKGAIVIDALTGRVLYEKNADEKRYPASMTKIMTAILALERGSLSDKIMIGEIAAKTEDSEIGLLPMDEIRLGELLKGLLILSDNAASVAIAEYFAPSVYDFTDEMNRKARLIGMQHTFFTTPHGLFDKRHFSTPRDMVKLFRYAEKNSKFREILATEEAEITWENPPNKKMLAENTNLLLEKYRGMLGGKTGWTEESGGSLAASTKRGNITLYSIVMEAAGQEERFSDTVKILDDVFTRVHVEKGEEKEALRQKIFVSHGDKYQILVEPVKDINYPLLKGEDKAKYTLQYDVPTYIEAPLTRGEVVGKLIFFYDQQEVGSMDIVALEDVQRGFNMWAFWRQLWHKIID